LQQKSVVENTDIALKKQAHTIAQQLYNSLISSMHHNIRNTFLYNLEGVKDVQCEDKDIQISVQRSMQSVEKRCQAYFAMKRTKALMVMQNEMRNIKNNHQVTFKYKLLSL
jgi:GMP synthase PP-ATPase subunit